MVTIAYILLGSNIGDRLTNIHQALSLLSTVEDTTIVKQSSIIETQPLEFTEQPDFLNCVVEVVTGLDAVNVLHHLLDIENALGRVRTVAKGPRTIDCDLLLFGNVVCTTKHLILPHPQIYSRPFVWQLLSEINMNITDPVSHKLLNEVVACHQ
ncbi:MAG: 2-amino-4-hydroxy-6-hydroxymethyldihydropteridine diphosphokinase [Spirochaetes bacterium]|nr:2-amino-4-hydroxy-6-hydroxymethyldihydropteridine diphosphokinase [Spirochaetota bacterium]HOE20572.1 2-amino-4-hydroxy-6-hydroxymethyldihydropteridine diphosphokinase [Spirochaetota bacterium]